MIEEKRRAVQHAILKGLAIELLKTRGFMNSEIHKEYQVRVKNLKPFIVDVVGLKPEDVQSLVRLDNPEKARASVYASPDIILTNPTSK